MDTTTVGVDLAKNVFVACVADCTGRIVAWREFNRAGFLSWLGTLPTGTVIGMEACGSAHHWGRTAQRLGLAPRLMAAEFVRPYRKHSLRVGWVEERTALLNRVRGLLAEFGMIVDPGPKHLRALLVEREFDTALSPALRGLIQSVRDQLDALDARIGECDRQITAQQANDPLAKRARDLPGVGLITADAVTASVGDASMFRNGRQFAAWLGLTPSQSGSGGKTKLGRITRRGDDYLRTLLVQGARSVLAATLRKQRRESPEKLTRLQQWIVVLNGRIGYHKTLVAIANKHARQLWAVLAKGESYNPQAWQRG